MRISVIGNGSRNIGVTCAADFALAGHDVRLAVFPEEANRLQPLIAAGEILVDGEPENLVSGRVGRARPQSITTNPMAALGEAEVIVLDVPMGEIALRFSALIPHLPRGVIVHAQSYGCWAAALLTNLLTRAGRDDVVVTEARAPSTMAKLSGGTVTPTTLRRGLALATMPSRRVHDVIESLRPLFPGATAAASILQTGLENINLMVHPAMALLGVAIFERAELNDQPIAFYREANVPSSGRLGDALDAERAAVCAAYGVRHESLPETLAATYGARGNNAYDAVLACEPYQRTTGMNPGIWRDWLKEDIPFGVAPLILLGEQAGAEVPLHRAVAQIFGTIIGFDPWTGPSLDALGLAGTQKEVMDRVNA